MKGSLVAPPTANLAPMCNVTWNGTNDPLYPIGNVKLLDPSIVAKTDISNPTLDIQLPVGPSPTLEGIVLINTNLAGRVQTLQNANGLTQPKAVPPSIDGLCVNVYWDLRAIDPALRSSTLWRIFLDASGGAAIGTLLVIGAWQPLRVRWEWTLTEKLPVIEHRTGYGKRLIYQIPVRTRSYEALPFDPQDRAALRRLRREAHGAAVPWPLVPDTTDEDVLLVQFLDDEHPEKYKFVHGTFPAGDVQGVLEMPIAVEEVNAGVRL